MRDVLGIVGRALFDPVEDCLVELAIGFESASPGVRDGSGGLHQQQALRGLRKVNAAADDLLGDAPVIARGIVAEEREVEAVFAGCGTVAAALVAARAEEDGHDVEAEADGFGRRGCGG